MVFRSPISKQRNGGSRRLGITLDRSQCSQISISPVWPSCFKVLVRSNSALDTGGASTSSNLLLAQSGSPPNSDELTAQTQPDANAPVTTAPSPKKTRKRVEGGGTRSLNCRIATVFPSAGKAKHTPSAGKQSQDTIAAICRSAAYRESQMCDTGFDVAFVFTPPHSNAFSPNQLGSQIPFRYSIRSLFFASLSFRLNCVS